tara:strand:- start:39 stop:545 length:507 start_codon:yes stop_codon:yes gene_type:complete
MAAPIILGVIGRYLLKHGIKKAIKKYGKTAVNKVVKVKEPKLNKKYLLRLKTKLIDKSAPIKKLTKKVTKTKPSKAAALKARKISTEFGKATKYSPSFMLRNMMRDAIAKKTPKKRITPLIKKLAVGGGIFTSGALTGISHEKGKQMKKDIVKMKKKYPELFKKKEEK